MGWQAEGPFRYDGDKLYFHKFPRSPRGTDYLKIHGQQSFSPYDIYSTFKDKEGNMWFGTGAAGLFRFDGETVCWMGEDHLDTTPEGGAFCIRSIHEDSDGKFWICNPNYIYLISDNCNFENNYQMISYHKEEGIAKLFEETSKSVPYFMSIIERTAYEMWFLSYEQGIWCYKDGHISHHPIIIDSRIIQLYALYKDKENHCLLYTSDAADD